MPTVFEFLGKLVKNYDFFRRYSYPTLIFWCGKKNSPMYGYIGPLPANCRFPTAGARRARAGNLELFTMG